MGKGQLGLVVPLASIEVVAAAVAVVVVVVVATKNHCGLVYVLQFGRIYKVNG